MAEIVGVIGSGIAGLSAAWMLRNMGCNVTVLEAGSSRGLDLHTVASPSQSGGGLVDAPLRITTPGRWPTFLKLCDTVGVGTFEVSLHLSFSDMTGATWLQTGPLPKELYEQSIFKEKRKELASVVMRLMAELSLFKDGNKSEISLEDFIKISDVPESLFFDFILPILSTICTCDYKSLFKWPAGQVLDVLVDVMTTVKNLRLVGGTRSLATALSRECEIIPNAKVDFVTADQKKVKVIFSGTELLFDKVFVACQPHEVDFLDPQIFSEQAFLMKKFPYSEGSLVTHSDSRLMPGNKRDWAALNYLIEQPSESSMWTVWLNSIEPSLANSPDLFQTWNPSIEPDESKVLSNIKLRRSIVNIQTSDYLEQLRSINQRGVGSVYFCGSYAASGVPLLESAVRSALNAIQAAGMPIEHFPKMSKFFA